MRSLHRRAAAAVLAAALLVLTAAPAPALPLGQVVEQVQVGTTPGYAGTIGPPRALTVGPDGLLWIAGQDGLARRNADGSISEFTAGITGSSLADVVAGPDGNLWFSEFNPPAIIGRATPDGTITEVAVFGVTPGFTSGNVQELLVGPDGNIWFSKPFNTGSGAIGRITPAGVVTEFTPPNPDPEPRDLVIGPDGRIWYTDTSDLGGRLMAVSTDGTFEELLAEGTDWPAGTEANQITLGADGNVYTGNFSAAGGSVFRITPDLDVTTLSDPELAGDFIQGVATVCGAVWVVYEDEQQAGAILRITPDGTITPFQDGVPASGLFSIGEGPDGDVWAGGPTSAIYSVGADVGDAAGCAPAPPPTSTPSTSTSPTTQPAVRPVAVTATPRFTG